MSSIKATAAITIRCSPEQVFAVLTDVAHHPDWATGPSDIRHVSSNPAQLGTTWVQVSRFLGQEVEGEAEVTLYQPNQTFGFQSTTPFPAQMLFTLVPDGGKTNVTFEVELEPGNFFSLAGPLLGKAIKDQISSDLLALKAKIENSLQARR